MIVTVSLLYVKTSNFLKKWIGKGIIKCVCVLREFVDDEGVMVIGMKKRKIGRGKKK